MEYQTLKLINKSNYQICQFNNGKGNAINLKMIEELDHYISNFDLGGKEGVVLTGAGNIFSVGLDIKELISLSDTETKFFFTSFFELVLKLIKFPFPLVSAINGHCPAGGCVLAICSDFRIMAEDEKFKIGLNELPVGVMATPAIFHMYSFWIGAKNAYQNLLTGRLLNPTEAITQGLIDQTIKQDEVLESSEAKMQEYLKFDQATWRGMKHNFRLDLVQKMKEDSENQHISTYEHFVSNDGRGTLERILENLAKR